jgi:hypothetical protein
MLLLESNARQHRFAPLDGLRRKHFMSALDDFLTRSRYEFTGNVTLNHRFVSKDESSSYCSHQCERCSILAWRLSRDKLPDAPVSVLSMPKRHLVSDLCHRYNPCNCRQRHQYPHRLQRTIDVSRLVLQRGLFFRYLFRHGKRFVPQIRYRIE